MLGPGAALAVDEPSSATTIPNIPDTTTVDPGNEAPLTIDQATMDALEEQGQSSDDDKSALEKASDFVTDNAPWFIIGIIVLAAIIAGILIMRGRPRKSKLAGTPKASKSNKSMRNAGGLPGDDPREQPAQVPSASELRRRKRAAIQRSREEERLRRKQGIEGRKAARRGEAPIPPAAAAGVAAAGAAGVAATGGLDPVEAEKQGARDQEIAAGAMARFDAVEAPIAPEPYAPATYGSGQTVPAPVSPSQTAPAAGVVTPDAVQPVEESYQAPEADQFGAGEVEYQQSEAGYQEQYEEPDYEPATPAPEPTASPEAPTGIIHEPSIESPGADAATGNAAREFLAGGAAGAVGGLAAARASKPEPQEEGPEVLDPVIAPEPGMAPEHALADVEPVAAPEVPAADAGAAAAAEERLRAKVAEIKATQTPRPAEPEPAAEPLPEPGLLGPDAELSPGLAAVERRLSENSEERDRALREAEDRLRRVEQRAEDAERRAAFAERLAQLKVEESEREKRLNDVVSGIDRAEQRAREAEARAEAAERAAAAALEQSDLRSAAPNPPAAAPDDPPASPEPPAPERSETRAHEAEDAPLPPPQRKGLFGRSTSAPPADADAVNLNSATFEELREAGLSVTQATRILAYRERFGGYGSIEDLEKVPGFPADLIESLEGRITI